MSPSEVKALVSLLEDDDEEVILQIEQRILTEGVKIIPDLEKEWEEQFNPIIQRRLEDLIHLLQIELLKQRLTTWNMSGAHDLLEGLWIVSTFQYPDVEYQELLQEIEQIYYEVWREFSPKMNPFDQIKILNSVLFDKLKFKPNTKNFHSPANSMFNMVLETKKGNPISLCCLYMLIANKLKMPIFGVNLPNLFIVTYKNDDIQFYINVFNKGLIFSSEDIDQYIKNLHLAPQDTFYQPCGHIEIIQRSLRNLIVSFEKLGEYTRADEVKQLLLMISDSTL